ncbi:hypothetical protein [Mycobacterium lepromatosis]|uniref:hypothetical protein n=1 Tax=Mycobacterium lepromatosis TaxID=480418 RepID=UPI001872AC19|nr:hypothetical protein [Mycobacterium lepromatosis]
MRCTTNAGVPACLQGRVGRLRPAVVYLWVLHVTMSRDADQVATVLATLAGDGFGSGPAVP